tara:strand:+ start:555 stop:1475 length:921 start_codon:yes stop_codon:yes gene_type:complete
MSMYKYDKPSNYDLDLEDEHDKKKKKKKEKKEKVVKDLKIYPIKIEDDKKNEGEDKYPLCSSVHLLVVIGRVKAGKSLLINNLYLSERFYKDDFQTRILISSTAHNDAINKYMIDEFDFVFTDYTDELLTSLVDLIQEDEGNGRWLILLDDIIGDVKFSRGKVDAISALASKFRHIGNGEVEGKLSICITTQYFKYLSTILRSNATGYYLMGSFPEAEMKKIAEALSFFGNGDKNFMEIFRRSRKEDYDFLFCSVQELEARRNHEDLIWSKDNGFSQPFGDEKVNEDISQIDNIVLDKDNGEQAKQ